jgi:cardiolipin synthase
VASWELALTVVAFAADFGLRLVVAIRIVMRRRPLGETLSWLVVVLVLPFLGALVYLVVGESRLGAKRARLAAAYQPALERWVDAVARDREPEWQGRHRDAREIALLARATLHAPPLDGNRLELFEDAESTFRQLIRDIDGAIRSVDLEYYIWWPGRAVDDIAEAVIRAADRGVRCRVLIDAIGGKGFLRGSWAKRLQAAGVDVVASLPVGPVRSLFVRIDLRNHRKIAVIDHRIAYTGSHNLADPMCFKQGAGVGQWVDATVRLRGPAVEVLAAVFEVDWHQETEEPLATVVPRDEDLRRPRAGGSVVQVLPSGPGDAPFAIQQVVLSAIYAASTELVLSTPYFVPDEPTLRALASAAYGGVRTVLIVPARNDHTMVELACQASYDDLLAAGVEIWEYEAGLLHSKAIVVDRSIAFVGSLNMDMRSFWLNFEVTLLVNDDSFAADLRALLDRYLRDSRRVDTEHWAARPFRRRFLESVVRLAGPVL